MTGMNKCCYQCPDRWVTETSRCHDTCEKFQALKAVNDQHKEAARKAYAGNPGHEMMHKAMNRNAREKKRGRK